MNHYFTNNNDLKSERRVIKYQYNSSCFTFVSDNGVFAKDKIDYGSILLVEEFLKKNKKINNFLDVGCGYGFLSVVLAGILKLPGVGVDINERALKLALENVQLNNVRVSIFKSEIYELVEGKFDLIITNPPIRAGKAVVLKILMEAQEFLSPRGELWFVMHKDHGAKSILKKLNEIYRTEIQTKNKGFYIISCKKELT